MTNSLSVNWSEGVNDQESGILTAVIDQVFRYLFLHVAPALTEPPIKVRVFGNWVIPALVPDKPYWGTQWYIEESYESDVAQVIGPTFLELVRREPWQLANPHYDLALLDDDLTDFPLPLARLRPDHYAMGTSLPGMSAVLSVYRLREIADERLCNLALGRLVRHNLGHVLGVPDPTREANKVRFGLETHCTNRCVMRHAATVDDLARLAIEEADLGWPFCAQCTSELYSVIIHHALVWN